MQDYWKLIQVPNAMRNPEMTLLSEAMYHARELAMARMEEEADDLGADGIVGVRLAVSRYDAVGKMAEFVAIGTAIIPTGDRPRIEPPTPVLDLTDR